MQIAGYLQTSLIEWPGKIASVIFVPGCNFRCPFCHNRDLVDTKKTKKLPKYHERSVLADLKKRRKWIDGVVVTGGEPLLQADLSGFLSRLKRMGFETMLETNGSLPGVLQKLIGGKLVDYVAMDYKTTFGNYEKVAKIKNQKPKTKNTNKKLKIKPIELVENVKKSMRLILSSGLPFEFRTTVMPGIHDEKVLVEMAKELRELAIRDTPRPRRGGAEGGQYAIRKIRWYLQNFQPKNCLDPEFEKKKPYDIKKLEGFLGAVKKVIPGAELRGN